ncbi:1259_t:CDS:2, partial [Scutellospora calospora]
TNYTGYQCKGKFQNLVRDHTLMCQYMARNHIGCRTRTEVRYFKEFCSCFWERPEVLSMINMSHRESPTNNVSNVNDADGNSGYNTNDVSRNLDNVTYLSLPNLANTTSTSNISASQNDSNISMPNIGGSQPSCIENINEED